MSERTVTVEIEMLDEAPRETLSEYTSGPIRHLSDTEHVRRRTSMYLGVPSHDPRCATEVVFALMDLALMRRYDATFLAVQLEADHSITVRHNAAVGDLSARRGQGLAGYTHRDYATFTTVGLSDWAEVDIVQQGMRHRQLFSEGYSLSEPCATPTTLADEYRITFHLDARVVPAPVQVNRLLARLAEAAGLHGEMWVSWQGVGDAHPTSVPMHGLGALVCCRSADRPALSEVLCSSVASPTGDIVEVAFQILRGRVTEPVVSYANAWLTSRGGTHVDGFLAGLVRTMHAFSGWKPAGKDDLPGAQDYAGQLVGVVSAYSDEMQYVATRDRCLNASFEELAADAVHAALRPWLEDHPEEARQIQTRAWERFRKRQNAQSQRAAKQHTRTQHPRPGVSRTQRTTPALPASRGRTAVHG
jgi:DNA gyrase subunit B